jgi:hypothetical protein
MKSKKNKLFTLALVAMTMLFSAQIVFAATTWSNPVLFNLNHDDDYWHNNLSEANTKTTSSTNYDVYNIAQTMTVNPSFRLINSAREARSSTINMPNPGYQKVGGGNTGTIGYAYYSSTKPDILQTSDGSIRLQFKSR